MRAPKPSKVPKPFTGQKTQPKPNSKAVRAEVEGTQEDLARCPGPESDHRGSRHVALWPDQCPFPHPPQDCPSFRTGTHCHRPEIPVSGCLAHFLPFWREVIQADHWVLEVVSQGYAIKLLWTP